MKQIKYAFTFSNHCNMCHAKSNNFKILGKRLNKSQGVIPSKKTGITTTIVQCQACGLIFPNPLPRPETIDTHYSRNSGYSINQGLIPNYFKKQIKQFYKLSGLKTGWGCIALDIGAGIGNTLISLKEENFDICGIEPSTEIYHTAITKTSINSSKLKNTSIENCKFRKNSFDFIIFASVLEHLYDPSAAIINALTWLKPSGLIYIEVPSSKFLTSKIVNFFYKITGSDYVTNTSPMHYPFHLYEFELNSFNKHAQIHGYQIIQYKYTPVRKTYLPRFLDLIKIIMNATHTGAQIELWLKKNKDNYEKD